MQSKSINELDMFKSGPTETFITPSGQELTIRERNGDDEDILSRVRDNKDGTAVNKFVAAISVNPKLTELEVKQLPVRDKYYTVLKSRIQSLGNILTFPHIFEKGDKTPVSFDVDLSEYLWDFSNPEFPKPGDANYFQYRCKPYPKEIATNPEFEFVLSSGKIVKMKYLTGVGESKALGKNYNDLTINDRFRLRDFKLKGNSGEWIPMENFKIFTARELTEMRVRVEEFDAPFEMLHDLTSPATGLTETISLIQLESFFFPMTL